jgi:GT2 family glycosyltransferase
MTADWQDEFLLAIPSVNGGDLLARMLPSLRCNPDRVVVIDQGSTDSTAAVCAAASVRVLQLGEPRPFTATCNIGAALARERGCKYLAVANNDIVFRTDVLAELHAAMERDPNLGIVAPSQLLIGPLGQDLCTRVLWRLDTVDFLHHVGTANGAPLRLESDFCELTCALVRLSVVDEIGFLDEAYEFYHEDADLGFRLRQAGYSCAYLPMSQIEHFESSTFSRGKLARKADYLARNKRRFATKHLGYGVNHRPPPATAEGVHTRFARSLHPYLDRYGLLDPNRPDLALDNPDAAPSDYLYTLFEADRLPARWSALASERRAIFAGSERMRGLFAELGATSFYVPFGIEPDLFHPWGPTRRLYDETTFLAVVDGGQDRLLRTVLEAWRGQDAASRARLVLFGRGLREGLGEPVDTICRLRGQEIAQLTAMRIELREPLSPLPDGELAELYRAVDFTIAGGTDSSAPRLESMACGVPCIFGSASELADPEAAALLRRRFIEGVRMSATERLALGEQAMLDVRSRATLRHTVMMFRAALERLQVRDPAKILKLLARNEPSLVRKVTRGPVRPPPVGALARLERILARVTAASGWRLVQFGTLWRERGFSVAGSAAIHEIRGLLARYGGRLSRLVQRKAAAQARAISDTLVRGRAIIPRSALLIGYIDGQLGLGESLRGLALALSRSSVSFAIRPVGVGIEGRRSEAYMPERYDLRGRHAVNLVEASVDELPRVMADLGRAQFDRSYTILRTYWELARAPEVWRPVLGRIDEIWAPNKYVAASLATVFDRTITIVPPCVEPPVVERMSGHSRFGLLEERFYFLFAFDYFSFPERKNPLAVVRAFQAAFPDPTTGAGLVLKSIGSPDRVSRWREDLLAAAGDDPRIVTINEALSREEMLHLLASVDSYISLHRAEGFGLGMVEALFLGKPVIATDYSGSTDFLSAATGYPVPYVLRPLAPGDYVHAEGQVWAQPDVPAAACAMRRVFEHRDEAASKTAAGRRLVLSRYSAEHVALVATRRLNEIFEAQHEPAPYRPSRRRAARRNPTGTFAR